MSSTDLNSIKSEFDPEKYLSLIKCPEAQKNLTRLRISANNFYIKGDQPSRNDLSLKCG